MEHLSGIREDNEAKQVGCLINMAFIVRIRNIVDEGAHGGIGLFRRPERAERGETGSKPN